MAVNKQKIRIPRLKPVVWTFKRDDTPLSDEELANWHAKIRKDREEHAEKVRKFKEFVSSRGLKYNTDESNEETFNGKKLYDDTVSEPVLRARLKRDKVTAEPKKIIVPYVRFGGGRARPPEVHHKLHELDVAYYVRHWAVPGKIHSYVPGEIPVRTIEHDAHQLYQTRRDGKLHSFMSVGKHLVYEMFSKTGLSTLVEGLLADQLDTFAAIDMLLNESDHPFNFDWIHDNGPVSVGEHKKRSEQLSRTLEQHWDKTVNTVARPLYHQHREVWTAKARELGLDPQQEGMRLYQGGAPHPDMPKFPHHLGVMDIMTAGHLVQSHLNKVEALRKQGDHPVLQVASDVLRSALPASEALKRQKGNIVKGRVQRDGPVKPPVERKSVGTCSVCQGAYGAPGGRIAAHGYRMPFGVGRTQSCPGSHYKPWEQSADGLKSYLQGLTMHHDSLQNRHDELHTAETIKLPARRFGRTEAQTLTKDHPDFEKHKGIQQGKLRSEMEQVRAEHGRQLTRFNAWKAKEGYNPKIER